MRRPQNVRASSAIFHHFQAKTGLIYAEKPS